MKLIIGNWKMYPKSLKDAKIIFSSHKKMAKGMKRVKTVVCPPNVFIGALAGVKGKSAVIAIGAQDSFWESEGARTGETSPAMIASIGATHVIIGHSERRLLGETNKMVSQKAALAVQSKLTVVLCVGEKSRNEAGEYFAEVREQLRASIADIPKSMSKRLVVAYEPIWAIGAKASHPATPNDFHEMSILIRRQLVDHFGKVAGFKVPILYGGSVDERNAEGFLKQGGADGLLIGRISLDPQKFGAIIHLAEQVR